MPSCFGSSVGCAGWCEGMPPFPARKLHPRHPQHYSQSSSPAAFLTILLITIILSLLQPSVSAFRIHQSGNRLLPSPRIGRRAFRQYLFRMSSTGDGGDDGSTLLPHLDYLLHKTEVILASKSPRRVEIFGLLGLVPGGPCFKVIPSTFAEDLDHAGFASAAEYAMTNAEAKGREVAQQRLPLADGDKTVIVVGSDTVVDLDGRILEKPPDAEEAFNMVKSLSGRKHLVHSGVAIFSSKQQLPPSSQGGVGVMTPVAKFAETTEVTFTPLSDHEIREYVKSGEPMDKAGAYGIQGLGGQMVTGVNGCYFNVMGFPMHRFSRQLATLIQQGLA